MSLYSRIRAGLQHLQEKRKAKKAQNDERVLEDLLLGTILSMDYLPAVQSRIYFVSRRDFPAIWNKRQHEIQVEAGVQHTWQNPLTLQLIGPQIAPVTIGEVYVDKKDASAVPEYPKDSGIERIIAQEHGYNTVIDAAIGRALDLQEKRKQNVRAAANINAIEHHSYKNGLRLLIDAKTTRNYDAYQQILQKMVDAKITDFSRSFVDVQKTVANFLDLYYEVAHHAKLEREQENHLGLNFDQARILKSQLRPIYWSIMLFRWKNRSGSAVMKPFHKGTNQEALALTHYTIGRNYLST